MKTLVITLCAVMLISSCSRKVIPPQSEPTLQEVVDRVQTQYKLAMDSLSALVQKQFPIKEADLILKTNKKNTRSGDITISIFKPSGKHIQTRTTTVTYVLTREQNPLGAGDSTKVDNSLRDAIVSTLNNFNQLQLKQGFDQMTKDHVVLDIDFSIEVDATLGLTFKLWGLGTDASLETDNTVDHELKLTFGIPAAPGPSTTKP